MTSQRLASRILLLLRTTDLLPGIIEKWNLDVSDEEVTDADNESDNEDNEASDNNQGDDQSSDGTRSEEEDDGNRGRNDDNRG